MELKTIAKTRKIGGSIVVTIPANIIQNEQIGANELIELEVKKIRKNYFGALKGIGHFTREDRMEDRMEDRI
jgi:antitoxin component of MazEF toxin-antitoxin module